MEYLNRHICKTKNLGVAENMFGGDLMQLFDEDAAAWVSKICETPKMVTRNISNIDFIKPIKMGHIIEMYGNVDRIGNTSITVTLDAIRINTVTGSDRKVASATMTFVRIDDTGESELIKESVKEKFKV